MYDLAIIGGGPAGSTLARLLGNKYKILLIERRQIEAPTVSASEKCCGGLIDPDAQKMLAKFGLGIPKSVLLSPQLFAVRTIDMNYSIERYYQRYYVNIDRNQFDRWLQSIIPSKVNLIDNCVFKGYEEKDDWIDVKFHSKGRDYVERVKMLIGADGAFSRVRRQGFSERPEPSLYVSIQEWFETSEKLSYYGAIFDEEITDFYSWTIPKENCIILGSALNQGADVTAKFELLKLKLQKYGFNFDKPFKRNGAFIARPTRKNQICIGEKRIALIGEAAGFISPSSAEGLSYAFKSSLALAKALEFGIPVYNDLFSDNLKPLMRNILVKNLKSPVMYNRHLRKIAMNSGLLSIDVEK